MRRRRDGALLQRRSPTSAVAAPSPVRRVADLTRGRSPLVARPATLRSVGRPRVGGYLVRRECRAAPLCQEAAVVSDDFGVLEKVIVKMTGRVEDLEAGGAVFPVERAEGISHPLPSRVRNS